MAMVMLVGLQVDDDVAYQAYRDEVTPLLHRYGGDFGYDLRVAEMLRSEVDAAINRVFTIRFPSATEREAFFSDPDYLAAKASHFEPSVASITIMAEWDDAPESAEDDL